MKILRLVFLSRIGGSGVGSVRFSVGGELNVAGLSRLSRIGSFSVDKSALDVDENELASDEVEEEIGA